MSTIFYFVSLVLQILIFIRLGDLSNRGGK